MQKIGYARVSSLDQNLDRQIAALRAEGCDRIYREKASGKDMRNRPELAKAIDATDKGRVGAGRVGSGNAQPDGRHPHHGKGPHT
jgi:DNA invertase Pin-like site-specific DNA recombinase